MYLSFFLEFITIPLILLGGMALAMEAGTRLRRRSGGQEEGSEGIAVVEGAVFGLMGLLLAFAFSGGASRFDDRRQLISQEANAVGTAWLRLDLLPAAQQPVLRVKFREYVDARLAVYQDVLDTAEVNRRLTVCAQLQSEIWAEAVSGAGQSTTPTASVLLLPALNEMFDIAATRTAAASMHPPAAIFVMLVFILLFCSVLAGYRIGPSGSGARLHRFAFVLILAITYYVIIDLEYPRVGIIRVDDFDNVLQSLRTSMGP